MPKLPSKTNDKLIAPSVATILGGSYAKVDRAHVETLATSVLDAAGLCPGYEMRLHAFMPPYANQMDAPGGYVEFWLEKQSEPSLMFVVEFDGKEHVRFGFSNLSIASMQKAAENYDPSEYASVACFDEFWLFACTVAKRLEVTKLHIMYGI
jgi:hypothetical protein